MSINYRPYNIESYQALVKMIFSLYDEDPDGESMSEEKINKTIEYYFTEQNTLDIILIIDEDNPIGYALLAYSWSNEYGGLILKIDELYIINSKRNQGIATNFLSYLETANDIMALNIETTPSNIKSLNYYKKLGFVANNNFNLIKQIKKA